MIDNKVGLAGFFSLLIDPNRAGTEVKYIGTEIKMQPNATLTAERRRRRCV